MTTLDGFINYTQAILYEAFEIGEIDEKLMHKGIKGIANRINALCELYNFLHRGDLEPCELFKYSLQEPFENTTLKELYQSKNKSKFLEDLDKEFEEYMRIW